MERGANTARIHIRRRDIILSTLLAVSLGAGVKGSESQGHEVYKYSPIPREDFKPVEIQRALQHTSDELNRDNSPGKKAIVVFPSPSVLPPTPTHLSKEELHKQEIQNELHSVILNMESHSDIFSNKYIQDVKMYYPFYKAVADKYNIDWYLLWIIHEGETGASAGKKGFLSTSPYVGGMQILPMWQKYAAKASGGLENLRSLPQRHANDWEQIALAAWIIDRNIKQYENNGDSKNVAVHNALKLYSALGPAERRFTLYVQYGKIFS